MKVMKAKKAKAVTTEDVYEALANHLDVPFEKVQAAVEDYFKLAVSWSKINGQFSIAGLLKLKLHVQPASPARKGMNPFTKQECVFKAREQSTTIRCYATRYLQKVVDDQKILWFPNAPR